MNRKKMFALLLLVALSAGAAKEAMAMLQVTVTTTGTVVGPLKELTFSAQGAVVAFGSTTVLPACLTASPLTFADVQAVTLNLGASLQSGTDYETWFCIGNIGTSAGIIHVSVSGLATGATEVFEQAQAGLVSGITYSPCDGASIAAGGVIAVRAHIHTQTVLSGSAAFTGTASFTIA
jgi:hypothetical protein